MSCPGDNYVVPGANPCSGGGGGGGGIQSVVAGNAISVDNTDPANPIVAVPKIVRNIRGGTNITVDDTDPEDPIINSTANETQAFGNNTVSVGVLTTVAATLATVGFTTSAISDVIVSATITVQTNSNTKYDNSFILTINGANVSSGYFIHSVDGVGHYETVCITGFRANIAAGSNTLRLNGLTNAPNGTMTVTRISISGLANLL